MELISCSPDKEHDSCSCWGLNPRCSFCCMKSNLSVVKTFIIKSQEASLSTVIAERRLTRQRRWKVIKLCEWEKRCREILLSHLWVWCQIVRFKKSQRCSEPAPQSDVGAFWRSSTVNRPAGWQWLHEAGAVTELWHFKHSWCVSLLFKQPLLMKI